ncbi:MAG: N-acetyl sugar amidotransferase [Patescibacteria group bacterium]
MTRMKSHNPALASRACLKRKTSEILADHMAEEFYGDSPLRCSRCLYDENTPAITFDENGECNYCTLHNRMDMEYPTGEEGARILHSLADEIRRKGKGKPFDVIVGVSGGTDSSYLLYKTKELGLRPLAVHFNNTWNTPIATENMHNVLKGLKVELHTHAVDKEEYDDILRSFLLAGTIDIDAPTDIALAATLYIAAEQYGIEYIFEGHSFRTEGVCPLGWIYMDGKYIKSVNRRFGHYDSHRFRTFPNLWMTSFLKWMLIKRIKRIRPLYYMDYNKEEAKILLSQMFKWKWYGGHHLENQYTSFFHSYFCPTRFGTDTRVLGYSALIRSGQMTREEGLRLIETPPSPIPHIIELVKERFRFSDEEFDLVMHQPIRTYRDFRTYKKTFEHMRPFFWLMYKMNLVPKSFYTKFTSKRTV